MPWTAPRTWTDEELIDEDIMNAHIRDNLIYLKDDQLDNTVTYNGESVIQDGDVVTV